MNFYGEDVVLFCRRGGIYYPTAISGVCLTLARNYGPEPERISDADTVKMGVRYRRDGEGNITVAGRRWLPPKAFAEALEADAEAWRDVMTFAFGDVVLTRDAARTRRGEEYFLRREPVTDAEFSPACGGFYGYINGAADGVYAVRGVLGPMGMIPHFEITLG